METAKRGYVYEWMNIKGDGHYNLCVVVSAENRCKDNLISILFLSTDKGQNEKDVVRFKFNNQSWVVRTDLVTYTRREYLTGIVTNVQPKIMAEIDRHIARSLGISSENNIPWETMYNNLLNEVIKRGTNNE